MPRPLPLLASLAVLLVPATAAADHDTPYQHGEAQAPLRTPAMANVKESEFVNGPCTGEALKSMPAAAGHDHLDMKQHAFSCRMDKVFFDPLDDELARQGVVTGEMDVKGNLMAIAVAYPESGFLLYDISDPAKPEFLSQYRGQECEQLIVDVDCGAYVDISPDLQRVYISVQSITAVAQPGLESRLIPAYPGMEIVDISVPTLPVLRQAVPIAADTGGVHTTKSFLVPETGGEGPREPGEYTVSIANGTGLAINQIIGGVAVPVTDIALAESHDTFIQDDPILNRTLLYVAGGFDTGFYVFDITAPSEPVLLAEWDLTPQCSQDWYSHTIDVAVRNGRRYVTMPTELIDFFGENAEDPGCGKFNGNGDLAGPLWIVDATDLTKLGPADLEGNDPDDADTAALRAASEAALVATWNNAPRRAGGELTFSPHNQQIVGNKIYLSQYHGGVVVLDATEAFAGKNVRPHELAMYVPHDEPVRPIPPDAGAVLLDYHFVTGFIDYHPLIWDMFYANGHLFVPDMTGGLYALREDGTPPPVISGPGPAGPSCDDRTRPRSRVTGVRLSRRSISVKGRASDRACGKAGRVANVSVVVARLVGKRCAFLAPNGKFERPRSCSRIATLQAKGTSRFTYSKRVRLPRGRYLVYARATDAGANRERVSRKAQRRTRVR